MYYELSGHIWETESMKGWGFTHERLKVEGAGDNGRGMNVQLMF